MPSCTQYYDSKVLVAKLNNRKKTKSNHGNIWINLQFKHCWGKTICIMASIGCNTPSLRKQSATCFCLYAATKPQKTQTNSLHRVKLLKEKRVEKNRDVFVYTTVYFYVSNCVWCSRKQLEENEIFSLRLIYVVFLPVDFSCLRFDDSFHQRLF